MRSLFRKSFLWFSVEGFFSFVTVSDVWPETLTPNFLPESGRVAGQ